jgi:hypothetical protein
MGVPDVTRRSWIMTRTILFAAGFAVAGAVAASTVAFAQDVNTVSEVDVKAELGDVKDANALEFWPNLTSDLEKVIMAEAGPRIAEDGYELVVSLKEVSLSGSTLLSGQGEFNRLQGWVYFIPAGETVAQDQEPITIEAITAPVPPDAVGVIVPGKPVYYAAMLQGFAASTMNHLDELDSSPVRSNEENRQQNDG